MLRLPPLATAALLGVLLALTLPPLPTGILTPVVLAALLMFAAAAPTPREVAGRIFVAQSVAIGIHLAWLMVFLGRIFGQPLLGGLGLALYALEGAFYALMAYVVARLIPSPRGRVWGLAGGWVLLEALRFLGPFAFPWPTLGYSLIDTPMIQIADLGGVLLCSALVTLTAAALVRFWQGRAAPLWLVVACWLGALSYGITRTPASGPESQALLQRTTVDAFAKAGQLLSPEQQFTIYNSLTLQHRRPGEVAVWTETAIQRENLLPSAPAGGIYGVARVTDGANRNQAVAWTGQAEAGHNDKARPVPFGEYFPLRQPLAPVWNIIERGTGMLLESTPPAPTLRPLTLNGVQYGTYICYDSVFPWVARQLTGAGANVLVNISNDGWYAGWGVQQHFLMGRVRAIENRRWVLRSVNEGIAAVIDDLGQPVQTLSSGQGVIHARFRVLNGQTVFDRVGDWPALLLTAGMVGVGLARRNRR